MSKTPSPAEVEKAVEKAVEGIQGNDTRRDDRDDIEAEYRDRDGRFHVVSCMTNVDLDRSRTYADRVDGWDVQIKPEATLGLGGQYRILVQMNPS